MSQHTEKEYAYLDQDTDKYADYETALRSAAEYLDGHDVDEIFTIERGVKVERIHADYIDVDRLIKEMQYAAHDEVDDCAWDYLDDIDTNDDKKNDFKKVISDWMNENCKQPDFFAVTDIEEIDFVWTGEELEELNHD